MTSIIKLAKKPTARVVELKQFDESDFDDVSVSIGRNEPVYLNAVVVIEQVGWDNQAMVEKFFKENPMGLERL